MRDRPGEQGVIAEFLHVVQHICRRRDRRSVDQLGNLEQPNMIEVPNESLANAPPNVRTLEQLVVRGFVTKVQ